MEWGPRKQEKQLATVPKDDGVGHMTLMPPEYFEPIRREAADRCDRLEADPVLAAPWRQLFRQVLSPRHVLSEMLQNADDVEAPWARAAITDGVFVFEHGGTDFDPESLQSLCRFGFSNKRRLHTIGFRGVGFKSLFSLGPWVEVHTPTLAIGFHQRRFTEPIWLGRLDEAGQEHTTIRVAIDHPDKLRQMEGEIELWATSPVPLLFFGSVCRLELQGETVAKETDIEGPVPGSKWVWISGRQRQRVLHLISAEESFPEDALEEVRMERAEADFDVPPCRVHLVLGEATELRLYAVLPTDVVISTPFSCNAPFVQDPARTGIKAPSTSPTNAWLLHRLGRLASAAMIDWLGNENQELGQRAGGYCLLPPFPDPMGWSIQQQASRAITEEFGRSVDRHRCLLVQDGTMVPAGGCRALPDEVHDVWQLPILAALFGNGNRKILARDVAIGHRTRLNAWGWLGIVSPAAVAERLSTTPWAPRPESWEQVLVLWDFLQSKVTQEDWHAYWTAKQWAIIPAQDSGVLQPSGGVLVVGGKETAITEDDWIFLTRRATLADQEWMRLLSDSTESNTPLGRAKELGRRLGLDQRVGIQQVIEAAAGSVFATDEPGPEGIRIAQIAARADVVLRPTLRFLYLCCDGKWRPASDGLMVQTSYATTSILPEDWVLTKIISDQYTANLAGPEIFLWQQWSGRTAKSGLRSFPISSRQESWQFSRWGLRHFWVQRGGHAPPSYYYARVEQYRITDFDFDKPLWTFWEQQAREDPCWWGRVLRALFANWPEDQWLAVASAVIHENRGATYRTLDLGDLAAGWLHRFRELPCLPDTYGHMCQPAALLRNTADTAPLIGVERFLGADLDRPEHVKALDLLGVRSQPADADKLIVRLRALTLADQPPLAHIVALYQALDRVLVRLPAEELAGLREVFHLEKLIRTEDGTWQTRDGVFQENTDGFPDVSTVQAATKGLPLWDRLEVSKQPSLELALEWLRSLRIGFAVREGDRRRVRDTLRRAPGTVWESCGAWLDLSGRWTAVGDLHWKARTQEIGAALFATTKQRVGDLSMLDESAQCAPCFVGLRPLELDLEWRVVEHGSSLWEIDQPWIVALGRGIADVRELRGGSKTDGVENDAAIQEDHATASRLARSRWQQVGKLLVAPHIDGEPVGPEREQKAAWDEAKLYVQGSPAAHYQTLVAEVSRPFRLRQFRDAVAACVDRLPTWIQSYLEEHFVLGRLRPDELPGGDGRGSDRVDRSVAVRPGSDTPSEGGAQNAVEEKGVGPGEQLGGTGGHDGRTRVHTSTIAERFRSYLDRRGSVFDQSGNVLVHATEEGPTLRRSDTLPIWIQLERDGSERLVFYLGADSLYSGTEIPAHVWQYFENRPTISFLLLEEEGGYRAYAWTEIRQGIADGSIESHASGYRIRAQRAE